MLPSLLLVSITLFPHVACGWINLSRSFASSSKTIPLTANSRKFSLSSSAEEDWDTVESLSIKLEKLVEQEEASSLEIARTSLLYSRIENLLNNNNYSRTHVGVSTVCAAAGRGLFASTDCQSGDLLTCYPGDALVIIPNDENQDWTILWGDHVKDPPPDGLTDDLMGYLLHAMNDEIGILALPQLEEDSSYLGHFANDGVARVPKYESDLSSYVLDSQQLANAMHTTVANGAHMMTVATRDISAGDEIFVSYGPDYWMDQPTFLGEEDYHYDANEQISNGGSSTPGEGSGLSSKGFG